MMADIDKETFDFQPTFDDTSLEPVVLPHALSNLLVNGAAGIAVGMATNIPPHNLREVVDALVFLLDNPQLPKDERLTGVLERVPGPDFPTAGFLYGREGIRQAYHDRTRIDRHARQGRDRDAARGIAKRSSLRRSRTRSNKARLIERIAELVRDKRIDGISDVRDESDREGMRIVVDVRKGENSQVLLNNLYKNTPLQESFGINHAGDRRPAPTHARPAGGLRALPGLSPRNVVRGAAPSSSRRPQARAHVARGLTSSCSTTSTAPSRSSARRRTRRPPQGGADRGFPAQRDPGRGRSSSCSCSA